MMCHVSNFLNGTFKTYTTKEYVQKERFKKRLHNKEEPLLFMENLIDSY